MVYLNYFISVILWQFLNPLGFYQSFMQNFGQTVAILQSFFREKPVTYTPMSLPFHGKWKVFNSGADKSNSHSWNVISQRYAYDFVLSGETYHSDRKRQNINDYLTFNENVYSPNDGVVIKVKNNIKDNKHAGTGWIDIWTNDLRGNFVIIRHDDHVYSLVAHLKKGSCLVKKGDLVKRGQLIAGCGNSGHSTQPHIHFQIQDKGNWYFSKGLPIVFSDILKKSIKDDDFIKTEYDYISKNDIVLNAKSENAVFEKADPKAKISGDLITPLIQSIINTLAVIVGVGFVYYTIIKSLVDVVLLILK